MAEPPAIDHERGPLKIFPRPKRRDHLPSFSDRLPGTRGPHPNRVSAERYYGYYTPDQVDAFLSVIYSRCRRKIEMTPGAQSRDDIPRAWQGHEEREFACIAR